MKAIILAAGRTISAKETGGNEFYFPENSKPKCLFHIHGEALLEKQVRTLRGVGINDIRIVVGYKKEMIEEFNEEKNLGLEIVYNPTAESDRKVNGFWIKGMESVKAGLQGIDDDVLIILGDVSLKRDGVKKVLEDEHPIVWVLERGWWHVFKIAREKLPLLRKYNGAGVMQPLRDFCAANEGVEITGTGIDDVDYYTQTDEGKT